MQNKFPCWLKLQAPTIYVQINRTLQQGMHPYYGNMGCRVFKQGVQNWKDFCLKINIPKENY